MRPPTRTAIRDCNVHRAHDRLTGGGVTHCPIQHPRPHHSRRAAHCPPPATRPSESCHASVAEHAAGSAARTAWHDGRRIGCDFGPPADGHQFQDRRARDLRQVGSHELPAALRAHGEQAVELAVSRLLTQLPQHARHARRESSSSPPRPSPYGRARRVRRTRRRGRRCTRSRARRRGLRSTTHGARTWAVVWPCGPDGRWLIRCGHSDGRCLTGDGDTGSEIKKSPFLASRQAPPTIYGWDRGFKNSIFCPPFCKPLYTRRSLGDFSKMGAEN